MPISTISTAPIAHHRLRHIPVRDVIHLDTAINDRLFGANPTPLANPVALATLPKKIQRDAVGFDRVAAFQMKLNDFLPGTHDDTLFIVHAENPNARSPVDLLRVYNAHGLQLSHGSHDDMHPGTVGYFFDVMMTEKIRVPVVVTHPAASGAVFSSGGTATAISLPTMPSGSAVHVRSSAKVSLGKDPIACLEAVNAGLQYTTSALQFGAQLDPQALADLAETLRQGNSFLTTVKAAVLNVTGVDSRLLGRLATQVHLASQAVADAADALGAAARALTEENKGGRPSPSSREILERNTAAEQGANALVARARGAVFAALQHAKV